MINSLSVKNIRVSFPSLKDVAGTFALKRNGGVLLVLHEMRFKVIDAPPKCFFQQRMASDKSYSQAMGYVCHKLLNTIFAILKSGEKYKPVYPPDIDVSKLADNALNSQK